MSPEMTCCSGANGVTSGLTERGDTARCGSYDWAQNDYCNNWLPHHMLAQGASWFVPDGWMDASYLF